ncbi:Zinc finger and SCAN domain-containing protein 29 [Chelonia mydas]|uniref:Zinc finger and SCAN domain-containing protein 29 n=1 Tax=Chelonia mydas TaxID=8469 RepID=M7BZ67_CHEMY|nr:Zinc finger and SCAN domain-containing protein 29 [Chelonia mydas]
MMESQNRKRAPAWTEQEVRNLIALWGEESVLSELHSSFRNAKTFVKISQGMKDRGHNRDPKQCRVKLKELRQAYQKTREANGCSRSEPQTCRFYDELHAILGGSATTIDSFNGDGGNTEAGFGDEEDDDDDEVVDSSQQASGETGFPDSQELFLTLDLEAVPSEPTQGCLPDLPGGEGTSACTVHTASSQLTMLAFHRRQNPVWSTPELLDLLGLWEEEAVQSQVCSSHRNFDTYGLIASGTEEKGHERDMHQCHAKIKELRQVYQKAREANHCFGAVPKTCHFYKELHVILGGNPTSTTKSTVDTSGGLEGVISGLKPEDEVMEEEVELEDNVEHTTELYGGVVSQDLFLILEGSIQFLHSGSGTHDEGDGSSTHEILQDQRHCAHNAYHQNG